MSSGLCDCFLLRRHGAARAGGAPGGQESRVLSQEALMSQDLVYQEISVSSLPETQNQAAPKQDPAFNTFQTSTLGMVDPGERVSVTLRREFGEEALNALQKTKEQRETLKQQITELFNSPSFQVYKGYVDDPRNTDNAWMETVAVNYHDASGSSVAQLPLEAGDDAGKVAWVEIDSTLQLYASHARFLEIIALERGAHWE
ncbi:ADP-ribose pyrophosphatase, mitochondrial [Acipenser ruthenus]|uniref:ADP-ribose pyrophosphatase, mitochondrial n=1 Tax=Acipenser ruthenus TaxID=7906 RepID=A0A444US07_ACIRT|nr:ADP-ribose pyrophosphatase, mitochondrial [Acipenser ruthenus]